MADVNELKGISRLNLHAGKLEEFKRLSTQCMEIVRAKDTGTLQYDLYLNDDQSECIFIERFRDSEALIEHNENLGGLLTEMLATGSISAALFGNPSEKLRSMWPDGTVRVFTAFLSM